MRFASRSALTAIGAALAITVAGGVAAAEQPAAGQPGASVPRSGVPGSSAVTGAAVAPQPTCPLGWPTPRNQGGLASLIGLAPLAGPFSSEAFALGSVYQPILRLAGPLLTEIEPLIGSYQPQIDPIITQVQGVEAAVLEAILPYYGPLRPQLIAAEGELAKVLTPILDRAYHSEAASCLVAWEAQQIASANGRPVTVASLAHPGAVVTLRAAAKVRYGHK